MKHFIVRRTPRTIAGLSLLAAVIWLNPGHAQPVETGPLSISGSLVVQGPVTVDGPLTVAGDIFVHGPLTAEWLEQLLPNDPAVRRHWGGRTFHGPLTVHGPLIVHGDLEVRGPLTVEGPAGAVGNIDAEGPIVERR
ncbi:hypothetical protein [Paraburkholderia sp. GAS42]|uniref:hypothetical protein n=1 Tax=Paraburkholderia sp. GAS42 TaxID=3035135 RepID=UPI003D215A02